MKFLIKSGTKVAIAASHYYTAGRSRLFLNTRTDNTIILDPSDVDHSWNGAGIAFRLLEMYLPFKFIYVSHEHVIEI